MNTGDAVSASPVGPGSITGFSERGYPQVNYVTVACLQLADGRMFDPHQHYANGVPEADKVKPDSER